MKSCVTHEDACIPPIPYGISALSGDICLFLKALGTLSMCFSPSIYFTRAKGLENSEGMDFSTVSPSQVILGVFQAKGRKGYVCIKI